MLVLVLVFISVFSLLFSFVFVFIFVLSLVFALELAFLLVLMFDANSIFIKTGASLGATKYVAIKCLSLYARLTVTIVFKNFYAIVYGVCASY